MTFLKWLFSTKEAQVEAQKADELSCVGEPVISFLESLKREPKRYKLERRSLLRVLDSLEFKPYQWMTDSFYVLIDRKTGNEYTAYVS